MQKLPVAILAPLLITLLFSGCSLFSSNDTAIDAEKTIAREEAAIAAEDKKEQEEIQELLKKGMDDYKVGKYHTALNKFEEVLDRAPFSKEAALAELKAADCSYYMKRFEEALVRYESFEEKHPTNESIPYIMFQKAMCCYSQINNVERDASCAKKAVGLFHQLVNGFPDSVYAPQAEEKLHIATEFLASHELSIAQFYMRTEEYQQAKARLEYLLAAYPESGAAGDAKNMLELAAAKEKEPKRAKSLFGLLFGEKPAEDE